MKHIDINAKPVDTAPACPRNRFGVSSPKLLAGWWLIVWAIPTMGGVLFGAEPVEAVYARIDAYLAERMQETGVPGGAFAVISNDMIVHFRGIGVADPQGRPIQAQTAFGIGSISKSFGTLAAMQLVEAGKLDLEAPVQRYLPEFRTSDPTASSQIKVRHLIYHQSGLPLYVTHADAEGKYNPTVALNRAIGFMPKVRLCDPPGQTVRYSDPAYVVLAAVVQRVSGRPFDAYLQEAVFKPLGMRHSFTSELEARKDGAATGYRYWFGKAVPQDGLFSCYFDPLAGGGLYCSTEDLAKYLVAHMNEGRNGTTNVLSEAGFQRLHRPEVLLNGWIPYAMGWMEFTNTAEWPHMVAHGGITPKYYANAAMLPDQHVGFVLLFNAGVGEALPAIQFDVARMLVGRTPFPRQAATFTTSFFQRLGCVAAVLLMAAAVVRSVWLLARRNRNGEKNRQGLRSSKIRNLIILILCTAMLVAVVAIPRAFETCIEGMLDYVPDIACMLIAAGALASLGAILQVCLLASLNRQQNAMVADKSES